MASALLTLRRKGGNKANAAVILAALAAAVVFFLTSGWNGVRLVNMGTVFIALLTVIPARLMMGCEEESEEDIE